MRIVGLRVGGDNYLVKPFVLGKLATRLEALLWGPSDNKQTLLHFGALELNLVARRRGKCAFCGQLMCSSGSVPHALW